MGLISAGRVLTRYFLKGHVLEGRIFIRHISESMVRRNVFDRAQSICEEQWRRIVLIKMQGIHTHNN